MTYRVRALVAGLAITAITAVGASAAFGAPGSGANGATVISCSTLSGGSVHGVAVITPGSSVAHGDPACIAWLNSGF